MSDGAALHSEGNALLKAVVQGKLRLTRLLLEGGAYINEGNERGETCIAAACRANYEDPQTRPRMVRYLLEKGADPNIPDKCGRTALMHACAERSGKEVVTLLLENGADPSLRDYSGSSALVLAIDQGEHDTLTLLLDACKAKGKEVIIITTSTSPSGTRKTRQYLNAPPSPGMADKPACMSPSEVELGTTSPAAEDEGVFRFTRPPPEKRLPPRRLLKRLNSEPWGLVAPSVLAALDQSQMMSEFNGLSLAETNRPRLSRRHSIETPDSNSPKVIDCSTSEYSNSQSDKLQQIFPHRNTVPEGAEPVGGARFLAQHQEADGSEYNPGSPDSERISVDRRKLNISPLSLLTCSSRDSLENIPSSVSPVNVRRRPSSLLERRGSGTMLLDHIAQSRPGFLPPLNINPHRPIPDIRANGRAPSPVHCGPKLLLPAAPSSPKRASDFKLKKKLMRRHSMQTEQMKQLSTFQEILAEKVSEAND